MIEWCSSSGNYTQALEDFEVCRQLQAKHLEPDSRQLAETNYQMGLAYCLKEQYSQAIQHLNNSIQVIKSRQGKVHEVKNALFIFGPVHLISSFFFFFFPASQRSCRSCWTRLMIPRLLQTRGRRWRS